MSESSPRLLCIGSALVDVIAHIDEATLRCVPGDKGGMVLIEPEELLSLLRDLPESVARVPGGSAANTAAGISQLGLSAGFLGNVGDDDSGRFYTESLSGLGIDTAPVRIHPTLPTGTCISLVTPDAERTMRTCLGAASALGPDDITPADFTDWSHAHIEGYLLFNRDLMLQLLRCAREAGCRISLDLASLEVVGATMDILPQLLADHVDMVFANEDEARAFSGTDDELAALDQLSEVCEVAVVKLGSRGSCIRTNGIMTHVRAVSVDAVDTTAAGDMWAAGFLYGWYQDLPPAQCGRIASMLGAEIVTVDGACLPRERWAGLRGRAQSLTTDGADPDAPAGDH